MSIQLIGLALMLSLFAAVLPAYANAGGKKILVVVTSASQTKQGKQTGIWLEEYAVPYTLFKAAGHDITVASTKGGKAPVDPGSMKGANTAAWTEAMARLETTLPLSQIKAADYDAIYLPGGHGAMYDLPGNKDLQGLLTAFEGAGKVIASVCHGPAGFVGATKADGTPLVAGKTITSFTNAEESAAGKADDVPFALETELRQAGGHFVVGKEWGSHVEVDGHFVTGQNPASSEAIGKAIVKLLI